MTSRPLLAVLTATALAVPVGASGLATRPTSPRVHGCVQPGPYQLPQGTEAVRLDPGEFSTRITNPWWPMRPGTRWHYLERTGSEVDHVTVTVTHRTVVLGGITARIVHDVDRSVGRVVEDTHDYYAQDSGGSLWYFGEDTRAFENGQVSTAGSWRYGVDGAQAGVIVPANPGVGCRYREESHAPDAQDRARVLAVSEGIQGPTGWYAHTLHTANYSPVERHAMENKFYGRGVGPIVEMDLSPEFSRAVLVGVTRR
jgi:hypothetical protein